MADKVVFAAICCGCNHSFEFTPYELFKQAEADEAELSDTDYSDDEGFSIDNEDDNEDEDDVIDDGSFNANHYVDNTDRGNIIVVVKGFDIDDIDSYLDDRLWRLFTNDEDEFDEYCDMCSQYGNPTRAIENFENIQNFEDLKRSSIEPENCIMYTLDLSNPQSNTFDSDINAVRRLLVPSINDDEIRSALNSP